jgi:hypothetical protein
MKEALKDRNAVFLQGDGALCVADNEEEAEAIAFVLEKGCQAAVLGMQKQVPPIAAAAAAEDREVYIHSYAGLKDGKKKVLFFDIDGTLMDADGSVAESTIEALHRAKAKGHKLFVCTGRAKGQVFPKILNIGFDGVVAVAGAEVWVGEQVIFQSFMEPSQVERFLQFFENRHCSYGLQTAAGALCTEEGWEKTKERFIMLEATPQVVEDNMRRFYPVDTLHDRTDVEKLFYNFVPETVEQVQEYLGDYFHVEQSSYSGPDPHSGEITKTGVDKATGMAAVMDYYHLTAEDAIAFGDGPNDLEMIQYAGIGVAMGNGRPVLKEQADYVTEDISHDGIYRAMEHLRLI